MIRRAVKVKTEKTSLIDGPVGKLEVVMSKAIGTEKPAWGIVCHPHSLHGGTMNNKVVTTIVKAFQNLGVNTVRFNFRGVGQSTGQFDHGNGELDDLLSVINWVLKECPHRELWLAGFSFGSYVVAKAATQIPVAKLVMVSPPVTNFSMDDLPPMTCPWILVQGEKDDVVNPKDVFNWAEKREPKPTILRFPEAGHFFHGLLTELRSRLEQALII